MIMRPATYLSGLAVFFALILFTAPSHAQNTPDVSWYQCKLAGEIADVSLGADGQAQIKLDVKIAVFQHGFRAVKRCPFKKGERITIKNHVSSTEAADLKNQGRELDRGFNTGKYDLSTINDGDLITMLYGYYFEYGTEREVWNFLRIKRR